MFLFSPCSFAFVDFENTEDAKAALEEFNNTDIEGRMVRLEFCQSRDGGGQNKSGKKTEIRIYRIISGNLDKLVGVPGRVS